MSEDWTIQASYRFGVNNSGGVPQDLFNIRANSIPEFKELVRAANEVAEDLYLLRATLDFARDWKPEGASAPAPQPAPQPVPAPAPAQPTPPAPACAHGQMVFRSGTSKTGKAWQAWMCQGPEGQRCQPVWA